VRPLLWLVAGQLASTLYVYGTRLVRAPSPQAPPVPLYPPTAILLAVLLLTPSRRWWLYVAVTFGMKVASNLWGGYPLWFALLGQVPGVVEPLVGALLVRRFVAAPPRFARLGEVTRYAACVIAAAVLGATLGAAVRALAGSPFSSSWWAWFRGDALASLLLTPTILLWVGPTRGGWRAMISRRTGEAALLVLGLLLVGAVMFGTRPQNGEEADELLYAPVPLLLWAAVRFGPRGLSSALALFTVCAIPAVADGRGPFVEQTAVDNLLTLQLFLFGVGVPMFFLAALVQERQDAQRALAARTREVEESNRSLERRVVARTAALGAALADVAEREAALRRRVGELTALNEVAQALTAAPDLPDTLPAVAATTARLFEAERVSVWRLDRPDVADVAERAGGATGASGALARLVAADGAGVALGGPSVPLTGHEAARRALADGQPAVLPPAPATAPARAEPGAAAPPADLGAGAGGAMLLPLQAGGAATGLLLVRAAAPGRVYAPADVALGQTVAGALANALQTARLFDQEQGQRREAERLRRVAQGHAAELEARTRELATLLEVGRRVSSTLELQPLLALILEQLPGVLAYDEADIFRLEGGVLRRLHRVPAAEAGHPALGPVRWPLRLAHHHRWVVRHREALLVPDVRAATPQARLFRRAVADSRENGGEPAPPVPPAVGALLVVPLIVRDVVIGTLSVRHRRPGAFTPRHAELAQAVANQAAGAIENARLYREAQRAAAEEERRRLARELHDSVSQALFAASGTADVLPRLWELDPAVGREALADLRRLTGGAQAEMRALLLELRPEALARAPLEELLRTQVALTAARTGVPVEAALDPAPPLPPDVRAALYRIAQEALNNVAKHAAASRVAVRLRAAPGPPAAPPEPGAVTLQVVDDGRGFDRARAGAGRLGLGSMRERAAGIGATLRLRTRPGAGTALTVTWPGTNGAGAPRGRGLHEVSPAADEQQGTGSQEVPR
jgi:signal transduction histidine kinase/integral membrane sensor domain MASE1